MYAEIEENGFYQLVHPRLLAVRDAPSSVPTMRATVAVARSLGMGEVVPIYSAHLSVCPEDGDMDAAVMACVNCSPKP